MLRKIQNGQRVGQGVIMEKLKKIEEFNPRTYMELSIEEMGKSLNEPRNDGKVPPKVGAILLFPNGEIVRAHRGELRDGDHAEFTLLERKLGNKKLDDCILFTTLEPCVERTPPKIACCKRTSKTRIKTVYVGISDPDPTVSGKGIKHLIESGVRIKMFDRDLQKKIEDANPIFLRQALERKKKAEKDESKTVLERALAKTTLHSLSEDALNKFITEANLQYKVNDKEFHDYLSELELLDFDEKTKKHTPTGYGILLLGNNPRTKFKGAVIKASVDYGFNKIEPKEFSQPLVLIPDLIEEWLKKILPSSKDTSSFKRKDVPDFPISVLREAIINSIIHRNYLLHQVDNKVNYKLSEFKTFVEIDNEKIVVKSPGAPHPSISLAQLNKFIAPSISPNPIISYIFNLMNYAEETGLGMKTFRSLNETEGLPLPEYTYEEPYLILTFARNLEALKSVSKHPGLSELNYEELNGYEFIKEKGEISKKEYARKFGFNDKKAQRQLSKMRDLDLIGDNGEKPNSPKFRYVIK